MRSARGLRQSSGVRYSSRKIAKLDAKASKSEAEHANFVRRRREEEERRLRHDLRRCAIRKREILQSFRRRRLRNFASEAEANEHLTRQEPRPSPSQQAPRRPQGKALKDWSFYKRRGFIWSDLGRTPAQRLAVVLTSEVLKRDLACMNRLLEEVQEEEERARKEKLLQRERSTRRRECWKDKHTGGTVHNKPGTPPSSRRTGATETVAKATQDRGSAEHADGEVIHKSPRVIHTEYGRPSLTKRQERLALPKEPPSMTRSYILAGHTDFAGLLHADPSLKSFLPWHIDNIREDLTAARFAECAHTPVGESSERRNLATAFPRAGDWETTMRRGKRATTTPAVRRQRSARWPFVSSAVNAVASVEFDSNATLHDEESLSTATRHLIRTSGGSELG